jgi:site-specific DNA-methyltransferase (cytosine-N4-specific)
MVMTSPPYGDNQTTIPYGQYSYLPLHWMAIQDIDPNIDERLIKNINSIDSASLGGSLKAASEKTEYLCDKYVSAKKFIGKLKGEENGVKRFSSFFYDLDHSIAVLSEKTVENGVHAWTVGNRRICKKEVPMDKLITEMLADKKINTMACVPRKISQKKMAHKNSISKTMENEMIVLARKQ